MKYGHLNIVLANLGLSDKEASVYLAMLPLGATNVLKIARASGIKRTTVYSILDDLKQKGLVNIEIKGLKNLYLAENPERFNLTLKSQQENFRDALPELLDLYNLKADKGSIKYYEGLEAIKSVYEGMLRDVQPNDRYMVISDQKKWQKLDAKYFLNFIRRRGELNINLNIRLLLQDSKVARAHQKVQSQFNEKIKILPSGTDLNTNLVIIPKRVMIHQLVPPFLAVVMENKNIIKMHQEFFEIMWQTIPDDYLSPKK
ncbi:MAG: helix-turn-helix domain-containing protein [Patescibacteria group bacterium]|nr:helix-turn-helix domain-containing protein [Patescibacteria group bacterium]